MQLVLDTTGLQLVKKNNLFHLISEKGTRDISPGKLTSIAITASILISSDAVKLAIKHQIPILFFNRIGKAKARLWSPYFASIATLRRQQLHFSESTAATAWMMDIFGLKAEGQLANLAYLKQRRPRYTVGIDKQMRVIKRLNRQLEQFRQQLPDECRLNVMGHEGSIARIYWQTVGNTLPNRYSFQKRTRRPAEDFFNAALNYLYGMLYSIIEGGIFAAGLDPQIGILHADEYNKPTLTFDLIEPFRPWIDRLLIEQCLDGKLEKDFFTKNQYGLFFNKTGKAFIIPLFNDFLRQERTFLNRESTNKNHMYHLAGMLAQRIRSEETN